MAPREKNTATKPAKKAPAGKNTKATKAAAASVASANSLYSSHTWQFISANQDEHAFKLTTDKDFTASHANVLQNDLLEAMNTLEAENLSLPENLILDLSQTSAIDSIGIKLLVGLYKSCEQKHLPLQVFVSSPNVLRVLHLCKLHQFMHVQEV